MIDMNLSPRLVAFLADAGFDARHWSQTGPSSATDAEIMAFARTNEFIVVTHDLDFSAILAATNAEKPSVIQIRSDDLTPERIAGPLISGINQCRDQLASGALVTIEPARLRVRVLPFGAN